jgi:RNA polymerase sigma-70 factor (ECF subfamily)
MSHLANEAELVSAARAGSREAFDLLMSFYYQSALRQALGILQQREDAEDALQEAMLKAFRNLHRFQGNSSFYTWLFRITTNEALMKVRKRKGERQVALDEPLESEDGYVRKEIEDSSDDPEVSYEKSETSRRIQDALAKLSPRLRGAFWLRHVEGLSVKETAERLGLSTNGVKSRVSRARLRLERRLHGTFDRPKCSRRGSRKPRPCPAVPIAVSAEVEQPLSTAA